MRYWHRETLVILKRFPLHIDGLVALQEYSHPTIAHLRWVLSITSLLHVTRTRQWKLLIPDLTRCNSAWLVLHPRNRWFTPDTGTNVD